MVNYSNTKIYKIWSPQGANIYIGSTTKKYLSQRMDSHRHDYKSETVVKTTSKLIFEEYGVENCFIELIEAKDCKDSHESSQLEGHYIRTMDCVNKNIPGRTMKEYRETNKETIKEYRDINKNKMKEYQAINKEKLKEYFKIYQKANREKINQQQRERILKIKQSKTSQTE